MGVLVQLACETDFVAQNPEFVTLASYIAIHIAGINPEFVKETDIDEETRNKYMEAFKEEAMKSGKPEAIQAKIAEGKWSEFLAGSVLMNQTFLKDESKTIANLISDAVQKFGEKYHSCQIRSLRLN